MHREQTIVDRLGYGLLGAAFGSLFGTIGWWLYGLAHSLNYDGPGMDPILRHWITWAGGTFAVFGLLFGPLLGGLIGDTIAAIFHFEMGVSPRNPSLGMSLIFIAIVAAAIWFTVPK